MKTREQNKVIYLCVMDLQKAFDRVPRIKMWQVLEKKMVEEKLINAIRNMYEKTFNYVITGNAISSIFKTKQGLRQGANLSSGSRRPLSNI